MKFRYSAIICSFLWLSCNTHDSGGRHISEEQFVNLYADALVLREENSLSQADSLRVKRSLDSLYASYGITGPEFEASLQYYRDDLSRWKKFYMEVTKRLETVQQELREKPTK